MREANVLSTVMLIDKHSQSPPHLLCSSVPWYPLILILIMRKKANMEIGITYAVVVTDISWSLGPTFSP